MHEYGPKWGIKVCVSGGGGGGNWAFCDLIT